MNDVYRSYYTKNKNITSYMVSMINSSLNDRVLEPCGGDGMFIDALLESMPNLKIDTCDLDKNAINVMQSKYDGFDNISIRETDTLMDSVFDEYSIVGHYDKIIGNPPYGAWQEFERRSELKLKYKGFYVKETYALFLLRCISLLKERGALSFIIPDTFLYLHNHKQLRKFLLERTIIKEIAIFPSNFFPGVSFGYSNLCIITLEKEYIGNKKSEQQITIIKGLKSDTDLPLLCSSKSSDKGATSTLQQKNILKNQDYAFFIGDEKVSNTIVVTKNRLSDIADCVTGIYCGDNKRFLAIEQTNKRKIDGYPSIEKQLIDSSHTSLSSVRLPQKYIPIIKGSSSTPYYRTSDKWVIDWTESALFHYTNDKKARFQNPSYYFRKGIALPMVKSSKIRATLMDSNVFDQSIVGVFPHNDKYTLYILAYLNSKIANEFIHMINPTANNSANYLKKLPIYIPDEDELSLIIELVTLIFETKDTDKYQPLIDNFFSEKMQDRAA